MTRVAALALTLLLGAPTSAPQFFTMSEAWEPGDHRIIGRVADLPADSIRVTTVTTALTCSQTAQIVQGPFGARSVCWHHAQDGTLLPDPAITPGVIREDVPGGPSACTTKWGLDRRRVTPAMRRHVFDAYGVPQRERHRYELDHLVPRSLLGADDVANLWPQIWAEAHVKDRLEILLHKKVCRGDFGVPGLRAAQDCIRQDWRACWVRMGRP